MQMPDSHATLFKVLNTLSPAQKEILLTYAEQNGGFHRGRQWFGTGTGVRMEDGKAHLFGADMVACPVAAAFGVQPDLSETGWFSAKLDANLLAAIKHIIDAVGKREDGMEEYMKQLENTSPETLHGLVGYLYQASRPTS